MRSVRPSLRALVPPALLGWLLALLLAHHPVLLSGGRQVQGDEGDVRFNHYVLEHGWQHLRGAPLHARFWDPPMFHPARNTAAYSDVLLGVAPVYGVWRALGLSPDAAYQAWVLTLTSLNFLAALGLLVGGFRVRAGPAAVGAVLFAAGAARVNQLNHPQLLGQFYPLLAIGALLVLLRPETDRRRGVPWAALLVGACVAQLYGGFYWGWFLGFLLLVAGVVALASPAFRPRLLAALRVHGPALLLLGAVGLAALAPLVLHSRDAVREVGLRTFGDVQDMVPRFWSWFYLGPDSWLYGWADSFRGFRRIPAVWEHRLGLGLVTTAVAGVGLWQARGRPAVRVVLLVTVVTVLLVTRWAGGVSPWRLVFEVVPGAQGLRALSRIGVWLLLPASVGVALALQRQREAGRTALAAALAALVLLEQGLRSSSFDARAARADVQHLAAQVSPGCASFFYAPTAGAMPDWKYQLDAMLAALEAGVPTVNGYSGNSPPGWALVDNRRFTGADAARLDAALAAWARQHALPAGSICRLEVAAPR